MCDAHVCINTLHIPHTVLGDYKLCIYIYDTYKHTLHTYYSNTQYRSDPDIAESEFPEPANPCIHKYITYTHTYTQKTRYRSDLDIAERVLRNADSKCMYV